VVGSVFHVFVCVCLRPVFFLAVSNDFTPSLIFRLQAALSLGSCSQDCGLMPARFKEHFSWSLYRSFGLPWGLVP